MREQTAQEEPVAFMAAEVEGEGLPLEVMPQEDLELKE
jgi:hypothetical protein